MLTPMEIGDLLDLEKEATYPCSDGSTISCISVDALADAAYKKGKTEERERILKWLMLYAASTEPHREVLPTFGGMSPIVPCWRFRIPDEDLQVSLKEPK